MKVIVTPNKKMPIRGLLAYPFTDEKELDLTEMQIKRVLGYGAKVNVVSLDGIKAEITLANGELNTDAIKIALDKANIQGESAHPVDSTESEIILVPVTEPEEVKEQEEKKPVVNNQPQQHMTKAQRKAARRAEAQQRAAEEAAKKETEAVEESTETTEETETIVDEDAAKDNAEIIENETVEE